MIKEIVNAKDIKTLDSREVSEMMETRHSDLLAKIEKINTDLGERNFPLANYWTESTYKDSQNKERKCYNITKVGCDFLAHKMTGKKGNIFTARYIQKFEEMKEALITESYRIEDPIERAKRWIEEEQVRIEQAAMIEVQKPKVEYHDKVLRPTKLINITDIAKDMSMTGKALNKKLHEMGVIYRNGRCWKPYYDHEWMIPDYCDYNISEYGQILKWTEKGRKWILENVK